MSKKIKVSEKPTNRFDHRRLFLIRGLTGSGKTTLAKILQIQYDTQGKNSVILSADDFFYKNGEYLFDVTKLSNAHKDCQWNVELAMNSKIKYPFYRDVIIVHNTFSTRWEIEPYFKLAKENKFEVFVIECQNDFGSVHNVPDDVRQRMADRWEKI